MVAESNHKKPYAPSQFVTEKALANRGIESGGRRIVTMNMRRCQVWARSNCTRSLPFLRLDRQIDGVVYGLYNLSDEEIKVVEGENNG